MSLFIRKTKDDADYEMACQYIWNHLIDQGYPCFEYKDLRSLWEKFSTECYSANFLVAEDHLIDKFINWLEEQDA